MAKKEKSTTPNFDLVVKDIEEMKAKIEEAKEKAMKPARKALLADFKAAFDKHPAISKVRWSAYTPFFNDGDACTFSVNELELFENEDDDIDWDDKRRDTFPAVEAIDEDVMLMLFGDHVEVTLGRDDKDFTVEECEHD